MEVRAYREIPAGKEAPKGTAQALWAYLAKHQRLRDESGDSVSLAGDAGFWDNAPMTPEITITRPDDWHLHVRDGDALSTVVPHTAAQFGRAIIMPNLRPPVTTAAQAAGLPRAHPGRGAAPACASSR